MSKIIGVTVGTPINPAKLGGKSAYDVAVEQGFKGTEVEWLESLRGEQGPQGVSGVYVGSGDAPEDYDIQIDPEGSISEELNIKDLGNYFMSNSVEGALQEIGATLSGLEILLASI